MRRQIGLQEGRTLTTALAWLTPPAGKITPRSVMQRARIAGLLRDNGRNGLRADGRLATRLAIRAMKALPDEPTALADILHGLGLIAAWSDVSFAEPLIARLGRRRIRFEKVLAHAFAYEATEKYETDPEVIAVAQWLSQAPQGWDTFTDAIHYVQRGQIGSASWRFGLKFTAYVVASLQPRAVDQLVAANPNRARLAAVMEAALLLAAGFDEKARPEVLLRSRTPALTSLGAAALICAPLPWQTKLPFLDCQALLKANSIEPSDAVWMLGWRINSIFRELQGLERRVRDHTGRLASLEAEPALAFGGAEHAPFERARLEKESAEASARLPEVGQQLEAEIAAMVSVWPAEGLSDKQLGWLDKSFADSPELRHRLAEHLGHKGNRDWLLKFNIRRLRDYVGLADDPAAVPTTDPILLEETFNELAGWTARSIHLLYAEDQKSAGRQTSLLLLGLDKAFSTRLTQPFAAQRSPEKWHALMGRAILAARFVLAVVVTVPEASRQSIAVLAGLGLDFAHKILSAGPAPIQHATSFQRLAGAAVLSMRFAKDPQATARKWIMASALPEFVRALTIWSSSDLVDEQRELAVALFRSVCLRPLSSHEDTPRLNEMLSVLDRAMATAFAAQRSDLSDLICHLWHDAYAAWGAVDDRWIDSAEMLAGALSAPGPERERLLKEPAFAASHCRHFLN